MLVEKEAYMSVDYFEIAEGVFFEEASFSKEDVEETLSGLEESE